jgi:hypothetical protein
MQIHSDLNPQGISDERVWKKLILPPDQWQVFESGVAFSGQQSLCFCAASFLMPQYCSAPANIIPGEHFSTPQSVRYMVSLN